MEVNECKTDVKNANSVKGGEHQQQKYKNKREKGEEYRLKSRKMNFTQ